MQPIFTLIEFHSAVINHLNRRAIELWLRNLQMFKIARLNYAIGIRCLRGEMNELMSLNFQSI